MKIGIIVVALLVVVGGGAFLGLAMSGKVKVAGITPKNLMKDKKPEPEKKPAATTKSSTPPKKVDPGPDPVKGDVAVAKLWNNVDTDKLKEMTTTWKPTDLAKVLMKMDQGKVAEFLGELDGKRASAISKEIQKLAAAPTG